jgi:hypothetical protein
MVSLAVMWRLPLLHARDLEESLLIPVFWHNNHAVLMTPFSKGTTGTYAESGAGSWFKRVCEAQGE